MTEFGFQSHLASYMVGLIEQKRALGCKYTEQVKLLKKFDMLCSEQFQNEHTVTKPMLDIWGVLKATEHPGTLRNRVTVISHLAKYICALGDEAYISPTNDLPKETKYTPHIYTNVTVTAVRNRWNHRPEWMELLSGQLDPKRRNIHFLKHLLLYINCVFTRILFKMQSDVSLAGKAGKSG